MNLIKSFSIYALSTILNRGISLLLLPVFTIFFTTQDYGTLSLINTIVAVVTPFIILQVKGAISVEYYKKKDKKIFKDYLLSALTNPVIAFITIGVLFGLTSRVFAKWLLIDSLWFLMVPILVILTLLPQVSQTIFQISERPKQFSVFSLSKTGFELGLSLLLVVVFGWNYQGRLIGILITGLLFSIIAFFILKKQNFFTGVVRKKFRQQALWFGLPLVPHAVGAIVINASDRFFIARMVSLEELGIYSVGYAVGSIIMIIEHAFTQAWMPFFYKRLKENTLKSKKQIILAAFGFMVSLVLLLILIGFLSPVLFEYVFDKRYSGGNVYVIWVGLGYVFLGFYKIFSGFIFFLKKTKVLGYLSFLNVVINLTLNFFLIEEYGVIGAAYATTISFFIFFICVAVISSRLYPMPWFFLLKRGSIHD